ncbi:MAG: hypothetical protein JO281_09950 [Pseudonocardiales bacterium]|nr:hypothetical protein [Pseudonocardiales bacterium]
MNFFSRSNRSDGVDPQRPTRKQLPSRNLVENQLSEQAWLDRGKIDPDVFATAVTIHNGVINPNTGQQWGDRPIEVLFVNSCVDMAGECQNWTREQCRPHDYCSLQRATQAREVVAVAKDAMHDMEKEREENVKDSLGGVSPVRDVISNHKSDLVLAADRERDGDNRHLDKPVAHAWIVVSASVFAALDLVLLWRPVFQLAAVSSARMLGQWVAAVALTAATTLFIETTVRHYRRAERQSTDRRDAVRDRNRAVRRVQSGNFSVITGREPDLTQVDTVDGKLRSAGALLLGAAAATAVIGAARVAYLARGGGLSILESALFAVVAALFLGGLVVLMGSLSCRGNRLGDRLRFGTEVVIGVEQRDRERRQEVAEAREEARRLLVAADKAAAQAAETHEWVIAGYQRSMLLSCRWCGLDTSVLKGVGFGAGPRPLAEEAASKKKEVVALLKVIDEWLADPQGAVERLRQQETVPALPAAPNHAPVQVRSVSPPDEGQPSTVRSLDSPLPEEPQLSRRLMTLGVAMAVATAVLVAILTPPPEGDVHVQVTGSATWSWCAGAQTVPDARSIRCSW